MFAPGLSYINYLDRIMHTGGIKELNNFFYNLISNNKEQAYNLINDDHLHYSTLFILQNDFRNSEVSSHLNARNSNALDFTKKILLKQTPDMDLLTSDHRTETHAVLKWMFETGCTDDGLNNQYDEVMEKVAVLLVKVHKDNSILPVVAEMTFNRNRKGHLIYDLVWTLFEACNLKSFYLIANGLRSSNFKDVELARKLLGFIPCIEMNSTADPINLYSCCIHWLNDNQLFLYYTGENLQQTGKPLPYAVSAEAKYLCKGITPNNKEYLIPLTRAENRLLEEFNQLSPGSKTILSDYSFLLYRQNLKLWNKWRRYPLNIQLKAAKYKIGGKL